MRKIVVEFVVPAEFEDDYANECSGVVVQDFLEQPLRVLSDSGWPSTVAKCTCRLPGFAVNNITVCPTCGKPHRELVLA